MSDLIERLRELAELKYQFHTIHVPEALLRAANELSRLTAEVERLRANDGRYRWLRERNVYRSDPPSVHVQWERYEDGLHIATDYPTQEQLDSAIDAAIKEVGNG